MPAPLVLVTSIPRSIPTTLPGLMANATVNQRFGVLIAEAGGIPIMSDAWSDPERLAERIDAVVLNGGIDVDPERYGAVRGSKTDEPDVPRDEFEFGLARAAIERGLPVLGVCRGMQLLNVALGGTLHQDLSAVTDLQHYVPDPYDRPAHAVELEPGSILARGFRSLRMLVNTVHRQGVDDLGDGLTVVARAPDGTVEAFEDAGRGVIGVQWHPEFLTGEDAALQVELFRSFLDMCESHTVTTG
jgi:putative glutamine amidotransferase